MRIPGKGGKTKNNRNGKRLCEWCSLFQACFQISYGLSTVEIGFKFSLVEAFLMSEPPKGIFKGNDPYAVNDQLFWRGLSSSNSVELPLLRSQ